MVDMHICMMYDIGYNCMFRMYMKIIEEHHKDIRQSIRLHIIEDSGQVNKDV